MTKKIQILDFVQSLPGKTVTRSQLIRFIKQLNGEDFDPIRDRGCYSAALMPSHFIYRHIEGLAHPVKLWQDGGYLTWASKGDGRCLARKGRGLYGLMVWDPVKVEYIWAK